MNVPTRFPADHYSSIRTPTSYSIHRASRNNWQTMSRNHGSESWPSQKRHDRPRKPQVSQRMRNRLRRPRLWSRRHRRGIIRSRGHGRFRSGDIRRMPSRRRKVPRREEEGARFHHLSVGFAPQRSRDRNLPRPRSRRPEAGGGRPGLDGRVVGRKRRRGMQVEAGMGNCRGRRRGLAPCGRVRRWRRRVGIFRRGKERSLYRRNQTRDPRDLQPPPNYPPSRQRGR